MSSSPLRQVGENLFAFTDTCNVYVLRDGDTALLIDLGDGDVLDALASIGVRQVEWVLFTHHHREQCQGTRRLAGSGARLAVPARERPFFEDPIAYRKVQPHLEDPYTCYGASYLRPPRHPIPIDHVFSDKDAFSWRGYEFWVLCTPGHSPGSTTYVLCQEGDWIAFSGDLMLDGATMHTWFDSEWDYGYGKGLYALSESAAALERFKPRQLFPSHGGIVENGARTLAIYLEKLRTLAGHYVRGWDVQLGADESDTVSRPTSVPHLWQISSHLYKFTGIGFGGNFNMILSDSGHALVVDCGCWDTRFLDRTIRGMQERLGLKQIDAVVISHMHGDHILEAPHIRDTYGAEIWTLDSISELFEEPERFDYVCPINWYGKQERIAIDRVFKRREFLEWENFGLTFDWLPGQTRFGLILHGVIDDKMVAFTGDSIFPSRSGSGHEAVVARNSAVLEEGYIYCAEYLSRLQPDLILAGHSFVIPEPGAQIERFRTWAYALREAFQSLSPDDDYRILFDPFWVRADPYRLPIRPGKRASFELIVRNFRNASECHRIEVRIPEGWTADPEVLIGTVEAESEVRYPVVIDAPADATQGVQIATFDVTAGGIRYGERFDMIIHVSW